MIANKQVRAISYSNLYPDIFLKIFKVGSTFNAKNWFRNSNSRSSNTEFSVGVSVRTMYNIYLGKTFLIVMGFI
jgi:hypothetical protein